MRSLILVMALALSGTAVAQQKISNSKHDFARNTAAQATDAQICKYCHVPHRAGTTALWSHTATQLTGYTAYGTTQRGTNLGTVALNEDSRRCLDCHDGTVALGDLTLAPGTDITFTGTSVNASQQLQGNAKTGTDLRTNHPVSVAYPTASGYRTHSSGVVTQGTNQVTLTPGATSGTYTVECSTCHDPHNNVTTGNTHFLKVPAASSALCLTCHDK